MHCAFLLHVACGRSETGLSPCCCRSISSSSGSVPCDRAIVCGTLVVIAGLIKGIYDILLLLKFQKVRLPEEAGAVAG